MLLFFSLPTVQKSTNPAAETAKKKAELEKRLQDVSGKLGKSKLKSKKGTCSSIHSATLSHMLFFSSSRSP